MSEKKANVSYQLLYFYLFIYFLKITHPEEVVTPHSVEDLPPLSSVLLSVILKSPSVTGYIFEAILIYNLSNSNND